MKEKTSVTLSRDLLAQVDRLAGSKNSRSAFIERILRRYIRERRCAALHSCDLARINRAAEHLNREAADVLGINRGITQLLTQTALRAHSRTSSSTEKTSLGSRVYRASNW